MAGYDKDKLFEQSKSAIENDEDVIFIEDVISELPCKKTTFYKYFPEDSNELNELKELLAKNKSNTKKGLRGNWRNQLENATLQLALYKLLATEEERNALTMTRSENKHEFKGLEELAKKLPNFFPDE
jgi:hypothetical protein